VTPRTAAQRTAKSSILLSAVFGITQLRNCVPDRSWFETVMWMDGRGWQAILLY